MFFTHPHGTLVPGEVQESLWALEKVREIWAIPTGPLPIAVCLWAV